ncbi:hypothetical protein K466DRAFT_590830 [Polyporus arcularius HHB13444]|uniref:Uncharacterized protein n=1 Tax=Polyporus arcularius HHB13444 TaxID=1314778 RepID=A0A5C3NZ57_9APHY|nr:hypothetical protein K466DRAFT_590830 [Polyporus arcularius HHB13444]
MWPTRLVQSRRGAAASVAGLFKFSRLPWFPGPPAEHNAVRNKCVALRLRHYVPCMPLVTRSLWFNSQARRARYARVDCRPYLQTANAAKTSAS